MRRFVDRIITQEMSPIAHLNHPCFRLLSLLILTLKMWSILQVSFIGSVSCSILHPTRRFPPIYPSTYSLRCDIRLRRRFLLILVLPIVKSTSNVANIGNIINCSQISHTNRGPYNYITKRSQQDFQQKK